MSNQETINFRIDLTLSDPDEQEDTIPSPSELADMLASYLSAYTDVLYVCVDTVKD